MYRFYKHLIVSINMIKCQFVSVLPLIVCISETIHSMIYSISVNFVSVLLNCNRYTVKVGYK